MDLQGHGSHCLGTVLGRDINGTRIGVAQGVTDAIVSSFVLVLLHGQKSGL